MGRGWLSISTPVLARALFSFTSVTLVMVGSTVWQIRCIPTGEVMSSAAVAVVLGAAELAWLDQQQKHRPVRSCISWKTFLDDVVVGSRVFCCSCVFVSCLLPGTTLVDIGSGTAVHTWVDVELRVDPQYQQWKEEAKKEEGAVELQEQAEVLVKVVKEQFDQTMVLTISHYATAVSSQSSWCSKLSPCC